MATKKKTKRAVMILDTHRGIYFGYLVKTSNAGRTVTLEGARHCFYFPVAKAGHKGVYGLATVGPRKDAKIGPRVNMDVHDVAKIIDCTDKAIKAWEGASW